LETSLFLQTILETFIDAGFHNFYISTHYKEELVRNHFKDGLQWNVSIEYVHEESPLGTGGALGLLPKSIPKLPLIMMNGDLLTKVDYRRLLQYHKESGGIATMCVREYDIQVPYGVIQSDSYRVESVKEKPIHSFFVNAGIYVLEQELYQSVKTQQRLDMPDLIQQHIDKGKDIYMFPIHEYWLDIGRAEDFEKAQLEIEDLT
jgi:NDP-sugar pyrophosphorylase family protein